MPYLINATMSFFKNLFLSKKFNDEISTHVYEKGSLCQTQRDLEPRFCLVLLGRSFLRDRGSSVIWRRHARLRLASWKAEVWGVGGVDSKVSHCRDDVTDDFIWEAFRRLGPDNFQSIQVYNFICMMTGNTTEHEFKNKKWRNMFSSSFIIIIILGHSSTNNQTCLNQKYSIPSPEDNCSNADGK